MATLKSDIGTLSYNSNVGTNIQIWAGLIVSLLTAAGWVQTADTGQTAANALAVTTTTSQSMGYQIWRMNDTLQATVPVFLKIEFGSGTYSASSAGVWVTIGTGSDGAGNITGTLLARTGLLPSSSALAGAGGFYGSGANNRLVFALMACGATGATVLFSIERSKDSSGADTSNGLYVLGTSPNIATAVYSLNQYLRFVNNTLPNSTLIGAYVPSGSTWADDKNFGVCFLRYFDGEPSNPGLNLATYLSGDTASRVQIPVQSYGAMHQMMPLGPSYLASAASSNTNASLMMRWE